MFIDDIIVSQTLYTAVQSEKGIFFSAIKSFQFEKNKKMYFGVFKALFTLYCVK